LERLPRSVTVRIVAVPQPIVHVDAFTAVPFAGSPAAVCIMPAARDDAWMQHVAREMNLSETAFVVPRSGAAGAGDFELRWFTPTVEVDLCGHATLASAHVLWENGQIDAAATARFHTRSGLLTAARRGEWIELDFPATPDRAIDPPAGLVEAVGARPRYVGRSRFDFLFELDDETAVRNVRPDFGRLRGFAAHGVIVTSRADDAAVDFVSRYFAPAFGIDEDPVTGSTHCCLGPFWNRRLNKQAFVARQVSARGGVLKVALDGDRVRLGGQAVTVLRGELLA
jgi:predicted PhzF superfamily epimerase YddE/YHI9